MDGISSTRDAIGNLFGESGSYHVLSMKVNVDAGLEEQGQTVITYAFQA